MIPKQLKLNDPPQLKNAKMIIAFSGWMDGGDVSTGTVELLARALDAREIAEIQPDDFYIYNFPGSMELSSLFRPFVTIEEGLISEYEGPENIFYCQEKIKLILFVGKEPNLRWSAFSDCVFSLCDQVGIDTIYFIGSVAGAVPHTREPRLSTTVSEPKLKPIMLDFGLNLTSYEGPSSFVSKLMTEAAKRKIKMASIIAEIPAYVQGVNPKSIEAVTRKLASILKMHVNLDDLREMSEDWEKRLNDTLQEHPDLLEHIDQLEEDYDNEVFDTMGDLKALLQQKGIRLD